ncbi:MAG: alpha/beta hydrolase [Candidatus Binatia bacterium]
MRRTVTKIARKVARIVVSILFGGFVTLLTIHVLQARALPDLTIWHSDELADEYDAGDSDATFEAYLAHEHELFDELERMTAEHGHAGMAARFDRFSPGSRSNAAGRGHNWNRTYVLRPEKVRGAALLLHGLSDSPYSLRAVAEVLEGLGFYVVGLRVPGHGTIPGSLTRVRAEDWGEAVALAAREVAAVADKAGEVAPFIIVGYSNGSALAVDHTLETIENGEGRTPDQLILLSPALTVSKLAALARVQLWLSYVPGLSKLAWTDILPEYDPYKYNSFAVNAGRQIYRLTGNIRDRVLALSSEQKKRFPPVLAFGSAVDATVPPTSVLELEQVIGPNGSEIVLFDINRMTEAADFIRSGSKSLGYLPALLAADDLSYDLTIVTNTSNTTQETVARTKPAGSDEWKSKPLPTPWPRQVFSLSHVAVPFRPDDPVYGAVADDEPVRPYPPIGSLVARGEKGILGIPMDLAMRLRHNPFFGYVEERITQTLR